MQHWKTCLGNLPGSVLAWWTDCVSLGGARTNWPKSYPEGAFSLKAEVAMKRGTQIFLGVFFLVACVLHFVLGDAFAGIVPPALPANIYMAMVGLPLGDGQRLGPVVLWIRVAFQFPLIALVPWCTDAPPFGKRAV